MVLILVLYIVAAAVNLYIPRVAIDHKLPKKTPLYILHDFWHSFRLLWRDPLGQVSLAVTTLFWGAGVTLRLIVLTWAEVALKFDLAEGHPAHRGHRGGHRRSVQCWPPASCRCNGRSRCCRWASSWAWR